MAKLAEITEMAKGLAALPAVVVFAAALSASAATRTWTGGGDGSTWADARNWGGTAPAAGDDVVVSATSVNDLGSAGSPLALHSLTLSGAVTISGNPILIANGGLLRSSSASTAVISVPLVMGTALTPAVTNSVAASGSLELTGVVSGPANIWVDCDALSANVRLKAENTFDGNLYIRQGAVFAHTDGAFGSTAGLTDLQERTSGRTARLWFMGITTSENFNFKTLMQGNAVYFASNTTNILNGTVGGGNAHETWNAQSNAYVEFNNAVTNVACFTSNFDAGSTVKFNAPTHWRNTWYVNGNSTANVWINDQLTTTDANYDFRVNRGTYHLNLENALICRNGNKPTLRFPHIWFAGATTIDLCGYDQTFTYLRSTADQAGSIITSADPATMHLTCQTDTYGYKLSADYYGTFAGAVSLSLEGAKTMVFHGKSTSTGALSLSNGNTTMFDGGSWAGTSVNVSGASTLILTDANLASNAVLSVQDAGSTVELPDGVVQNLGGLFLDGEEKAPGYYGSAESGVDAAHQSAHFTGKGRVWVRDYSTPPVSAFWTGGGGTDYLLSTDLNWRGSSAPDLENGFTTATFADSGSRAEATGWNTFAGMVFDAPGEFTLGAANAASGLILGQGGIRATGAHEYTLDAPVVANGSQTWNVTNGAALRVGAVSVANAATTITRVGDGTLYLDGPMDLRGATFDMNGTGSAYLKDGASLGAAGDKVTLRYTGNKSKVYFTNSVVVASDIKMIGAQQTDLFYFANNTTSRITGMVDFQGPSFYGGSGTEVRLEGGIKVSGWFWIRGGNGFRLVIANKPITSCSTGIYDYTGGVTLSLAAPSNNIGGSVYVYSGSRATLELAAPWALAYPSANFVMGRNTGTHPGTIDLGGYDQGFTQWGGYEFEPTTAANRNIITSAGPGGIAHHREGTNRNIYYCFEDLAGYCKEGNSTVTFFYPSTTSNALIVTAGKVQFGDGAQFKGSWLNVTNVTVTGGTLETGGSVTQDGRTYATRLNPKADFYLSGGTLTIPDATVQRCKFLYLKEGGEWCKARLRRYCGTAGVPGTTHLPLLGATTGVLEVLGDSKGTMVIFR